MGEALLQLLTADTVAHAVFVFALVIPAGLALGTVRFAGIHLGIAGVLFAGLLFGHFKIAVNPEILEFAREFGLILFVYAVGMQVGSGFFSSFKRDGLRLNGLAAFVVIAGAGLTALLVSAGGIPAPAAVGIFSGATTNTPSLAAAQQALKEIPGLSPETLKMPALGYAVAYPFGVIGIILTMIAARVIFRIKPADEARLYADLHAPAVQKLETLDLRVENANLEGCPLEKLPARAESGIIISRIVHQGEMRVAAPDDVVHTGDLIRAVGPRDKLAEFRLIVGSEARIEIPEIRGRFVVGRLRVTRREVVGKTVGDLEAYLYGVAVTRIGRGAVEFPATPEVELNFADTVTALGDEESLRRFALILGDSEKELNQPELIPVFVGVALGVAAGSLPISLPGMPAPIKLGLAGGPLLTAIVLSRLGRIGRLIWYLPPGANNILREIGITLFLACVGLKSGDQFAETVLHGAGLYWMAGAAVVTVVPILLAALYARLRYGMNYLTLCGLLAGSMTDPPALAFAGQMAPSSAQMVSYAAVYPLVMLLRVICAQVMVMLFLR